MSESVDVNLHMCLGVNVFERERKRLEAPVYRGSYLEAPTCVYIYIYIYRGSCMDAYI